MLKTAEQQPSEIGQHEQDGAESTITHAFRWVCRADHDRHRSRIIERDAES